MDQLKTEKKIKESSLSYSHFKFLDSKDIPQNKTDGV